MLVRHVAWFATLLLVLVACGGSDSSAESPPPPAVQHHELTVDGLSRPYRLFVPLSLDRSRAAPLVLILAGVGNTGESMVGATGFDRVAEREGLVVAYPEGVNETWNAGYCCLGRATSGPDDVGFLTRLIDDIATKNRIDAERVYAVGVSAGAMMAYRLACERAERIAGVGSVAGAMVLDACRPSKPVSVIEIHGTADGLVPYEGGRTAGGATQPSPSTLAVAQRWAELNACPAAPAPKIVGVVSTSTWTACAQGTGVKLIAIDGGGHTWFAEGLGPVNGAVDATTEIWSFLSTARRTG
ncbi:MAG TPA: PHB depolymerase family esterase [Acidimicrobiia bacterium]|nr:PHB depolymerase family esterase [Acidimicrobiia bacterium]